MWICEACNEPLRPTHSHAGVDYATCCGLTHKRDADDYLPPVLLPALFNAVDVQHDFTPKSPASVDQRLTERLRALAQKEPLTFIVADEHTFHDEPFSNDMKGRG